MTSENIKEVAAYIARAANAFLWGYLFYQWLVKDHTWFSNIDQFLVLYTTFLTLGLIGQLTLGYIFYQRRPASYIHPILRKIPHAILLGFLVFISSYLLPHIY